MRQFRTRSILPGSQRWPERWQLLAAFALTTAAFLVGLFIAAYYDNVAAGVSVALLADAIALYLVFRS